MNLATLIGLVLGIALKLDPEFTEIQDLLRASKDNRLSTSEMRN